MTQQVIDLVGPHGYVHGWKFVGIPGVGNPRLVQPGDKIRTSFGHGLTSDHEVTAVHHGTNMTTARVRDEQGEEHILRMPHATPGRGAIMPHSTAQKKGASNLPHGKAAETAAGRRAAFKAGHALPPSRPGGAPGFPVTDARHWEKAFEAVGRAGTPARRAALKALLIRTAPEFGKTRRIKGSWLDSSNPAGGIELAEPYRRMPGEDVKCPNCGDYNMPDAKYCDQCGHKLPGTGDAKSYTRPEQGVIDMSARKLPVTSLADLVIGRSQAGTAVVRHRLGGSLIGEIKKDDGGRFVSYLDEHGTELAPHTHQRAALAELVRTWNTGTTKLDDPARERMPLQQPAHQTPAMQVLGIPAVNLAMPAAGASDAPRMTRSASSDTDSDGDSGDDTSGLSPKGASIYKKLRAKGFPAARAMAFAKRAQNFGSGGAGK